MSTDGANQPNSRLDSWKEIAAYLKRDIRTVQRWEKTANLPIRRLQKAGLRAVFAYTHELDDWLRGQSPSATEESPVAEAPPASSHLRRRLIYAGFAVILVGAVIAWLVRPEAAFGPLTARPITSDPGGERDPDISPDGMYVAYVKVSPDLQQRRLEVRLITGGEPRVITAGSNDWSPAWSPDGERIAFLRGDPEGNAMLLLISALGGGERKLSDVRPIAVRRTQLVGHLLAWTPDGRHIVVPDRLTDGKGSLILINTETGARAQLTSPGEAEYDIEPSLSSDGRLLLFNRIRGEYLSDVFVQPLDSISFRPLGSARRLPAAGDWNGTPRLLEDRGEVLFCAGTLPRLSLWRQAVDGSGKPTSLGIIGDSAVQSAVNRKTGRIVFRTFRTHVEVLRFSVPAAGVRSPQEPQMVDFLKSTFLQRSAIYSPDGTQVAFISDRTGRRQLWVSDSSGNNPMEWMQGFEVDLPPPSWSSDGSRIVFTGSGPSGSSQLFIAERATRTAAPLTNDALDYVRAVWSHDGKYLLAAAADKSVYGIYRLPPEGGPPTKILPEYRYVAGVEPSGKGLYVARRDRRGSSELDYVPFAEGPAVHLATLNFADDTWVTREGIYYLALRDDDLASVALCFRSHDGAVKVLQEFSTPPGRGLSVSPDGRFVLTSLAAPTISDLQLLQTAK